MMIKGRSGLNFLFSFLSFVPPLSLTFPKWLLPDAKNFPVSVVTHHNRSKKKKKTQHPNQHIEGLKESAISQNTHISRTTAAGCHLCSTIPEQIQTVTQNALPTTYLIPLSLEKKKLWPIYELFSTKSDL